MIRKSIGVFFMCAMFFQVAGCGEKENPTNNTEVKNIGYQLEQPLKGEEIAEVKTNLGSFKIRFFPEEAPKAVENFKTLSKNGYYNGVTFHRIIKDFMIQGGDPEGTGMGGESVWGKDFEDEFSPSLLNITGSLSMANKGKNTNGSQFFINHQEASSFTGWDNLQRAYDVYKSNPEKFESMYGGTVDMSKITDEVKKLYEQNGGSPNLDGYYNTLEKGHTVFGQVFDGMETIKKISEVNVGKNDKPVEDVKIENIEIKQN